ncbi:MAG: hypothetical protein KIG94_01110 [Acetatifactor sp.]|nr:hypothetical protein [Acetatifactor sp.]
MAFYAKMFLTNGFAYGNDENRERRILEFSKRAYDLAVNIHEFEKRNE